MFGVISGELFCSAEGSVLSKVLFESFDNTDNFDMFEMNIA